jgi:RND superfamily putative drug exporter
MSRSLFRLGRFAVRRRWRVLGAWLLLLLTFGLLGSGLGGHSADDFTIPGTETQHALDLLTQRFPSESGATARIVVSVGHGTLADNAAKAGVARLLDNVARQPHVTSVSPLVTPQSLGRKADSQVGLAAVQYDGQSPDLGTAPAKRLDLAARPLRHSGVHVDFGGEIQFRGQDIGGMSEGVGLIVAVFVLLVAFGSVVAMGLPLLVALLGLGAGLSLVTVGSSFLTIPTVAPSLAAMIGLGVGIDYALFIVTRHREHLHRGMTVEESAGRAIATAGQAVLFAGTTVLIAICGLQFVGIPLVAMMGYATAGVVLVSVAAALTLLPALLGFAGHAIDRLKLPFVKAAGAIDQHGHASRWSAHVSRHPKRYVIGSLLLLISLTLPFFSIRLGQTDAGNDPVGSTTRQAYDRLSSSFGKGFNGPLLITVDLGEAKPETVLPLLVRRMAADRDVAFAVPQPILNTRRDTAILTVFPKSSPQDRATQELVHRLRSGIVPAVVKTTGVRSVYVAGETAAFIDISDKISSRLPIFIGAVLLLSFLLLLVVFRSILVPLKAALLNLLGIGAAYGVIVMVFQWGWGASLFGVSESLPIIAFLPMFMFAILFGLSMDYEVFLMSRIREEWLRCRDNRRSVCAGISSTARVITAAAIIMISVFGSFALGNDHTVQMMGVGLAVAIFLDATVIRMVLVPATMDLLGDRNWWLPGWLDRNLPHLDIEGEGALPFPEYLPGRGPVAPVPAILPEPEPERELVAANR